jgi:hypothetical protein
MAYGGARPGAGRKPGALNKATKQQRDAIKASGLTPLEYLLSVMRDEGTDKRERIDAAKSGRALLSPKTLAPMSR